MKATKQKKASCGDWHRTWGLGSTLLGTLTKGSQPGIYVWTGKSQGRHGQVYKTRHQIIFKYNPPEGFEILENPKDGRLPDSRDVLKAINELESA
jgi:hypothetical protein